MNKLNKSIICQMSEIKYDPNDIDSDRYYVYMNDGNSVYITLSKITELNKYDSNGNLKWSKKFSGSIIPIKIYLNNIFLAIRVDDAGAYLVKYDINGNETFSKNLNIKNDNRFSLKQIRIK